VSIHLISVATPEPLRFPTSSCTAAVPPHNYTFNSTWAPCTRDSNIVEQLWSVATVHAGHLHRIRFGKVATTIGLAAGCAAQCAPCLFMQRVRAIEKSCKALSAIDYDCKRVGIFLSSPANQRWIGGRGSSNRCKYLTGRC
jgi:hypothetical protein